MARGRNDDEDEEDTRGSDRGRDRDRDRGDDYDDDYDDRPRRKKLSGMDGFLNNTAVAVLMALFSFCCCPLLGIILGAIGLATCTNPDSKRNSVILLVAGLAGAVVGILLQLTGALADLQKR
jgi:hypothetical protein